MIDCITADEAVWNCFKIWALSWVLFLAFIYNELATYRKTGKSPIYDLLVEEGLPVLFFGFYNGFKYLISTAISTFLFSFFDDNFFIPWKLLIIGTLVNYAVCWAGLSIWGIYYLKKHNLKPVDKYEMRMKRKRTERQKEKQKGKIRKLRESKGLDPNKPPESSRKIKIAPRKKDELEEVFKKFK